MDPRSPPAASRALIYGLALAIGAANAFKPVHVDDTLYVRIAEQIVRKPLDPYGGFLNWQHIPEPTWKVSISPPLVSYYFAGILACGGGEVALHLGMIPWLLLAAWGLMHLSWRFSGTHWPAALTMLGPGFIAGVNLMLDVPLLAAMAAGVECACRAVDGRGSRWVLAAGLFAAAGVLIKYPAVAAILVFLTLAVVHRRPAVLIAAVFPFAALGLWLWCSGRLYGASQFGQAQGFLSRFGGEGLRTVAERVLTTFAILGMTLPLWLISAVSGRSRRWGLLFAVVAAITARLLFPPDWRDAAGIANAFLLVVFLGAFSFAEAVVSALRFGELRTILPLLVWIGAIVGVAVVSAPFVAVRYFLPVHLPLAVLAMMGASPKHRAIGMGISALLTGVLGVLVAWTDFRWAGVYPTAVGQIAANHPGREVYFCGHWGWQWYAEKAGFQAWDARSLAAPAGSLLLYPLRADPTPVAPQVRRTLRLLDQILIPPHPLRLTDWWILRNSRYGFRFYGGDFFHLPWGFTGDSTEEIGVFEVGSP